MSNWREKIDNVLRGKLEREKAAEKIARDIRLEQIFQEKRREAEEVQSRKQREAEIHKYLDIIDAKGWLEKMKREAWRNWGTISEIKELNSGSFRLAHVGKTQVNVPYYIDRGGSDGGGLEMHRLEDRSVAYFVEAGVSFSNSRGQIWWLGGTCISGTKDKFQNKAIRDFAYNGGKKTFFMRRSVLLEEGSMI